MSIKAEIVDPTGMTQAEARILEKMCEGLSNKGIAEALNVTENTVSTHVEHLYQKNFMTWQRINHRATLIVTAIAKGLVKITLSNERAE